jgi:drug/metabolite transporter (DMT)-like permease
MESLMEKLLLVAPFAAWGTSMPALKLVQPHISSPLLLGSIRLLPAGIILVIWASLTERKHPSSIEAWAWISLFAIVDGAMFQGFLAEGLTKTSAGLGSVIIDSQPLTVAILAALLFGEKLGPNAFVGLLAGVIGLLLVEIPQETWEATFLQVVNNGVGGIAAASGSIFASISQGTSSGGEGGLSGEAWMLLAAQSMAVGTVMVRYVTKHADSVYATGYHMIIGGIMLLLAVDQETIRSSAEAATSSDLAILSYISIFGGAASYGIFFYQASVKGNLTALSSLTFLTPLFAVAGGFALLGETLSPLQVFGAAVTLGSVYLINDKAPASESESKS